MSRIYLPKKRIVKGEMLAMYVWGKAFLMLSSPLKYAYYTHMCTHFRNTHTFIKIKFLC